MLHPNQGFTYNKFEKPNDWPKIDKTFDYKIENGKLLSGNEHIYLSGPVTYNIVGNTKITDGIASNFTTNNYITTDQRFDSSATNYEFVIRATPHNAESRNAAVMGGNSAFRIYFDYINGSIITYFNLTDDYVGFSINATFLQDVYYYIKLKRSGNEFSLSYSEDGITYSTPVTRTLTPVTGMSYIQYGYWGGDGWDPYNGKIDMNQTYIKVNDILWFYGKNYTTKDKVAVPQGLEYNNTTTPSIGWVDTDTSSSNFQQFTQAPEGTMIGKDDTHSLAVETYQDKGIVDYTVVGSPIIIDGVASGFSNSNYLQIPALPDAQDYFEPVNPFEMVLNVNIDTLTRAQYLYYGDFALSITASKNLELYYYDGEGIFASGTATLQDNTSYDIKLTYDGANIIVSYKTGNNAYTQDIVATGQITKIADTGNFGNRPTFNDIYLQGSINLNHTYIMVNGQYWFHPYPNSYPKLVGPESYTEVGSPSIINGIITYTSSSDYIQLNDQLTWDGASNLEVYCRFKTPSTFHTSNHAIISTVSSSTPLLWIWHNYVFFLLPDTNISVGTVTTDTWYRIKVIGKNNTWTRILYTDDGTELAQVTSTESTGTALTMFISIFRHYSNNRPVECVDLNNTYIKVNGALWFGKEDWEPSTYTDNSIYLLSGHSSDYSSYNELAFTPTINNSGTYSVEIDNQKVFAGMSRSTYIDWDKLSLTTGYNITTPSSLKAHTIKISPENNSNNIIGYNCNYDYIIKDGKLIDANPNIYWQNLTGGGEGTGFAYIDAGFKPTNNTTFEFAYTQKQVQGSNINTSPFMINNPTIEDVSYNSFGFNFQSGSFNYFGDEKTIGAGEYNVKRIYKSELDNNKNYYIYKTEGGTTSLVYSATPVSNQTTFGNLYLGCWHYGYDWGASLPFYPMLGNLYYAKFWENGGLIRHFVPVPAGLVIGNFTVPSNGMFDIVNQQFHPNLGTGTFNIGRDN